MIGVEEYIAILCTLFPTYRGGSLKTTGFFFSFSIPSTVVPHALLYLLAYVVDRIRLVLASHASKATDFLF